MKDFITELQYLTELLEVTYLRRDIKKTKHTRINKILMNLSMLTTRYYYKY